MKEDQKKINVVNRGDSSKLGVTNVVAAASHLRTVSEGTGSDLFWDSPYSHNKLVAQLPSGGRVPTKLLTRDDGWRKIEF